MLRSEQRRESNTGSRKKEIDAASATLVASRVIRDEPYALAAKKMSRVGHEHGYSHGYRVSS